YVRIVACTFTPSSVRTEPTIIALPCGFANPNHDTTGRAKIAGGLSELFHIDWAAVKSHRARGQVTGSSERTSKDLGRARLDTPRRDAAAPRPFHVYDLA